MASAVPASVRVRIVFGGRATRFGLMWIAMLLWIAVLLRFYDVAPTYEGAAMATITHVDEVKGKDRTRYEVHYEFLDENGTQRIGHSIADERLPLGEYQVEYDKETPDWSRLVGTEASPIDSGISFAIIMALAGLLALALELPDALRKLRFVRRSMPAVARVTSASVDQKKKPTTKLVFEYDTPAGVREGWIARSDVPGLRTYPVLPIRFVPDQPDRVLSMFDFQPGVMTSEGELTSSDWQAWLLLLLPAVTVVGLVTWIVTSLV